MVKRLPSLHTARSGPLTGCKRANVMQKGEGGLISWHGLLHSSILD